MKYSNQVSTELAKRYRSIQQNTVSRNRSIQKYSIDFTKRKVLSNSLGKK